MKKKSLIHSTNMKRGSEVLQLTLHDILSDIITDEKYLDTFGSCSIEEDVKNDKLIVKIDNDKNHIKMSLDLNDICKRYGYDSWKYIEVVSWEFNEASCVVTDPDDRIPMIQFSNEKPFNANI